MSDTYKKRDWKAWIKAAIEELRTRKFGSYVVADIDHDEYKIDDYGEWIRQMCTDPEVPEQQSS